MVNRVMCAHMHIQELPDTQLFQYVAVKSEIGSSVLHCAPLTMAGLHDPYSSSQFCHSKNISNVLSFDYMLEHWGGDATM